MHYVQKYLENLPLPKAISANGKIPNNTGKANISLYCNYYSFYSQKVSTFLSYLILFCKLCFLKKSKISQLLIMSVLFISGSNGYVRKKNRV